MKARLINRIEALQRAYLSEFCNGGDPGLICLIEKQINALSKQACAL